MKKIQDEKSVTNTYKSLVLYRSDLKQLYGIFSNLSESQPVCRINDYELDSENEIDKFADVKIEHVSFCVGDDYATSLQFRASKSKGMLFGDRNELRINVDSIEMLGRFKRVDDFLRTRQNILFSRFEYVLSSILPAMFFWLILSLASEIHRPDRSLDTLVWISLGLVVTAVAFWYFFNYPSTETRLITAKNKGDVNFYNKYKDLLIIICTLIMTLIAILTYVK